MMKLIIASSNSGKIKEYRDILEPLGFQVFSQYEAGLDLDVDETGTTFEENAILKARAVWEQTRTWVLSDDSGLEVRALNNEPGIYSARYKGLVSEHERRMAILDGLKDSNDRSAMFTTCICLMDEAGEVHLFKGFWKGKIAVHEAGESGFGYDPIFISEDSDGRTTAEYPLSFKEAHSHRAGAVALMTGWLKDLPPAKA